MSVYIAAPPRASNNIKNIKCEGTRESINYKCYWMCKRKFPLHEIKKKTPENSRRIPNWISCGILGT